MCVVVELGGGVVEQGRLPFARGSIPAQRRSFVKRVLVKYHLGKHRGSPDVAGVVANYLYASLELLRDLYFSTLIFGAVWQCMHFVCWLPSRMV